MSDLETLRAELEDDKQEIQQLKDDLKDMENARDNLQDKLNDWDDYADDAESALEEANAKLNSVVDELKIDFVKRDAAVDGPSRPL